MEEVLKNVVENKLIASIVIIIISTLIYNIVSRLILRTRKSNAYNEKVNKKKKTYIRLISNFIKYAFVTITVLILLQVNGINVSSMLAGVGIASAVIGLALQDALKDIIMGINIVTDDFFSIGDVVKYKDIEGKVVNFGLKTTKIQDLVTNNIVSISNRNINEIEKVSKKIYVGIPAPYGLAVEDVEKVIESIILEIKKNEDIIDCSYIGVSDFEASDVLYKLEVQCEPEYKLKAKRYTLRCIKMILDKNKIEIPFQQIDIHSK